MLIRKVLLIGGTGYIGSAVYRRLKQKYRVFITGRRHPDKLNRDFKYLDFDNASSIKKTLKNRYDLIIILAAKVKIDASSEIDLSDEVFKHNVVGLNNLFKILFKTQSKAKLVFISSMTVYDLAAPVPVSEDSALVPVHEYGLSKLFGEKLFSFYVSNHQNYGIIIRLPGVFGGLRKSGYIYNLISNLQKSQTVNIEAPFLGCWEAINIDDATEILAEFIKKYPWVTKLDIFNLGYGEEADFVKTAGMIKRLLKSESKIQVGRVNYRRFFLNNQKISEYVSMKRYSFVGGLKRFIDSQNSS